MFKAPPGTRDVLPSESIKWSFVEERAREVAFAYGYGEIRTPILEHFGVFHHAVGTASDIVRKEMYSFHDRGGRHLALRAEGTAPVVRSYLQHHLQNLPKPVRLYYVQPMFRYDRLQTARYRQFFQFGIEIFGAGSPLADLEVVLFGLHFLSRLGLPPPHLVVNSLGCPACRPGYLRRLTEWLVPVLPSFCPDCQERYSHNPLRLLDCKNEGCRELTREAPSLGDHICDGCKEHFTRFRRGLEAFEVNYRLDPRLVRGLDYYNRTVFEVYYPGLGLETAVAGGGRYDGMVEAWGGPPTPLVGMAFGVERLLLMLEKGPLKDCTPPGPDLYVASVRGLDGEKVLAIVQELRWSGIRVEWDLVGRSLGNQVRHARQLGARYLLIIGPRELETGEVEMQDLKTSGRARVSLRELVSNFTAIVQQFPR